MSVGLCWDLVHSGWKCKITTCAREKGAHKLFPSTHAHYTVVIFVTQNGAIVYGFLCTIHFTFTYVRWWHEFHKVYCTRAKLRVYIFVQTTKLPSDDYMHDEADCMLLMTAESSCWFYSWLCVRSYTFGRNCLCLLLTTNYNALITQNTKELCLEFPLQIPSYISTHCSTLIQSCSVHR